MKHKIFFIIISISLLTFSCKSKQQLVKVNTVNKELTELITKVQIAEPNFTTANISKMSADITLNSRRFNVSASCKIKKDSAIHMSISPFGFEMFKIEINTDSILAFDKMNKKLYAADFKLFENKFGVNISFNDIQAMFSNQYFNLGNKEIQLEKSNVSLNQNNETIINYLTESISQGTKINNSNRIENIDIESKKTIFKMQTLFSEFVLLDNQIFPQIIQLIATSSKSEIKCLFNISKVQFNKSVSFSNQDKSKFTRADINSFFNK